MSASAAKHAVHAKPWNYTGGMDLPMVFVLWADAYANEEGSWVFLNSIKDEGEYLVRTVGWLLEPGSGGQTGHVSVAQSYGKDGVADHILNIPNGMVREMQYLAASKKASRQRKQ